MENVFEERHADMFIKKLIEIYENKYDVKIKYEIVDKKEVKEDEKNNKKSN